VCFGLGRLKKSLTCGKKYPTDDPEKKKEKETHIEFSDFLRAHVGSSNMICWDRYLSDIRKDIEKDKARSPKSGVEDSPQSGKNSSDRPAVFVHAIGTW